MSSERNTIGNGDVSSGDIVPTPSTEPPIFNIPVPVLVALGIIIGMHLLMVYVFPLDIGAWLSLELGFSPVRYVIPFSDQSLAWVWSPVTYSILHGGWEHLIFNSLWLVAFGAPVAKRVGSVRFLVFWIASAAAAAALHLFVNWGANSLLVGASGVIAALMGAACRFAFGGRRLGRVGEGERPALLSVGQSLNEKTVRVFVLIWFIGNFAIAFGLPIMGDGAATIAWDAHIGGFVFGFFCFPLFDFRGKRDFSP